MRAAQKDAELIRDAAAFAGVQLDLAAAVRERFARVSAKGRADDDMVATFHASFDG